MTAVAVEITPRRPADAPVLRPPAEELSGVVIVADVDSLSEGATAPCNDDNPYQG
ncbi:hypothetical protein ABZ517_05515 [Streptomyces scabiei]|uniref:hypothetical protein n=1 Tax=Streptomyces scabiei TaxID=1930 RepID=UPI0033CBC5A7